MDYSDGNDLAGGADTELTLRFPGDPRPHRSHEMSFNSNNIGWPPVRGRSSRKKNTKEEEEEDESLMWHSSSCHVLMVKVAVDGAPFLRKVDLEAFSTYQHLLRALLEMFSCCFTIPPPPPPPIKEEEEEEMIMRNGVNRVVVVKGIIEYIPTYEDKDGDWMLLGDVPWEMFKQSCKRIRLVKTNP